MDKIHLVPNIVYTPTIHKGSRLEIVLSLRRPYIFQKDRKEWENDYDDSHINEVVDALLKNELGKPIRLCSPDDRSTWMRMGVGQINTFKFYEGHYFCLPRYEARHPKHPNRVTLAAGMTESFAELVNPRLRGAVEGFEETVCTYDNSGRPILLLPENALVVDGILSTLDMGDVTWSFDIDTIDFKIETVPAITLISFRGIHNGSSCVESKDYYPTFNFETRSFNLITPVSIPYFKEQRFEEVKDLLHFYSAERLPNGEVVHKDVLMIAKDELKGKRIGDKVKATKYFGGKMKDNYEFEFDPTASLRAVLNQMDIYPVDWRDELRNPYQ